MRKTPCARSAIAFVLIAFVYLFVARSAAAQDFCRVTITESCGDMVVGNTKILHAIGRPQGGTYSWSATAGAAIIVPNSGTGGTFTFDAVSPGFVMLTLTYTTDLECTTSANCTFRVFADTDGDGIGDPFDDCPYIYDPEQGDSDGDGVPDVCEPMCSVFLTDGAGTQGALFEIYSSIVNEGALDTEYEWEIYQSGGDTYVDISPTTGTMTLAPGEITTIPSLIYINSGAPDGIVEFTLVVRDTPTRKLLCSWVAVVTVLPNPPAPKPVVDLIVHKPRVLHAGEPAVLENFEENPGVMTVVNNDNDDGDEFYDTGDNDTDVAGENEMIKTNLRIKPATLNAGALKLAVVKGATNTKIWQKANKFKELKTAAELTFPLNTLAKTPDNNWLETTVWVEGVEAHTQQLGSMIELTYDLDPTVSDRAAITVVGVKATKWVGEGNGFTYNSNAFNSDILDIADANFPGPLLSYAVFPDGRTEAITGNAADAPGLPKDIVKLEVELTVPPTEDLTLYVRAFDVDDPSNETSSIDPNDNGTGDVYSGTSADAAAPYTGGKLSYTPDDDNRGAVDGKKFGKLAFMDPTGMAPLKFPALVQKQTIEFQVSHYPGDNYRMAINADPEFLKHLRNLDKNDGVEIVDPRTKAGGTGAPVPYALPYSSHILTVWRMLHVERDSMMALSFVNNSVSGTVQAIDNQGKRLTLSSDGVILNGALAPSLNDKSPTPPGRFEKGAVLKLAQVDGNFKIVKNGNLTIDLETVIKPDCVLKKGAAQKNTKLETLYFDAPTGKSDITITDTMNPDEFKDGTITIGAQTFDVETNSITVVTLTTKAKLDFVAVDDDTTNLLPENALANMGLMISAYRGAYIWPVFDGGGMGTGVETTDRPSAANTPVDFDPNIEIPPDVIAEMEYFYGIQSDANERDTFWVAYVLSAYQFATSWDNDPTPDSQGAVGGAVIDADVDKVVAKRGGKGCGVYLETIDDRLNKVADDKKADPGLEARVAAHEIGHQFGLAHDSDGINGFVMEKTQTHGPDVYSPWNFHDIDKNMLRCRKSSPGKPSK
ncbi:MAG: hypothetical protein HY286_07575 [Planctomycetes bacterium]|nr:hypothetical protein [Planctomycetota bacterium]